MSPAGVERDPGRRRVALLAVLAGVVALGIASRVFPIGVRAWDKALGDALYAAAVYLCLALVGPRLSSGWLAGLAFGACVAVELFQGTGIPAAYAHLPPVRWLLGTRFAWEDIVYYGIGIAAIAAADARIRRRLRAGAP